MGKMGKNVNDWEIINIEIFIDGKMVAERKSFAAAYRELIRKFQSSSFVQMRNHPDPSLSLIKRKIASMMVYYKNGKRGPLNIWQIKDRARREGLFGFESRHKKKHYKIQRPYTLDTFTKKDLR
jgi:hypothetical protein